MLLLLIGPPGSGKSTQGKKLAKIPNVEWVSVGRVLRGLNNQKLNEEMNKGKLLDDEFVNETLKNYLEKIDVDKLVILDGFPRHLEQAEWLSDYSKKSKHQLMGVIHLVLSEESAKKRLLSRGRPDDNTKSIKNRFKEYKEEILPIVGYFNQQQIPVYEVDAELSVEEMFRIIEGIIKHVH